MEQIISPVDKELIQSELTPDKLLRHTSKAANDLYVVDYHNAPNTLLEVGRLREEAFRDAGGGTGKEIDLDEFDTMDNPYQQLIVWDPKVKEILGGYRFIFSPNIQIDESGVPHLSTSHLFHFSPKFIQDYLPHTVELGRSFVSLGYQSSKAGAKALFVLDNLWDGLGALILRNPHIRYFFGKVTMYPSYDVQGRNLLLYFMNKYFPDNENLITPIHPLDTGIIVKDMEEVFIGKNYKEDYKILVRSIRALGYNIPPLINSYMNLSPTMKVFGTAINDEFGDVEETGILIKIDEIFEDKRLRYFAHTY